MAAGRLSPEAAPGQEGSGEEDELDELDSLLQQYEAAASADIAAARQKERMLGRPAAKRQKPAAPEQRQAAMNEPLAADNKGFKLLAAMGYREGQGIGKQAQGRTEPLPLLLKQDKLGLGATSKKAAAREQQRQREAAAADRAAADARLAVEQQAELQQQYQQRALAAAGQRSIEGQLRKAQAACQTLDMAAGLSSSRLWPQQREEHEQGAQQQRSAGGREAEAPAAADNAILSAAEQEAAEWAELPAAVRLEEVLLYLRHQYCYCLYCGCQYSDAADLAEGCPGLAEEDH